MSQKFFSRGSLFGTANQQLAQEIQQLRRNLEREEKGRGREKYNLKRSDVFCTDGSGIIYYHSWFFRRGHVTILPYVNFRERKSTSGVGNP
jgi:hypothetical protein